tara:strand:+ start:4627 stop:5361 length:735 start_codon:yes stop_codon:yes gene_type:complete
MNTIKDDIIVEGPFCTEIKSTNIISDTLTIFRKATSWYHPLTIKLHKQIPVSAGLGGGSADAATTLRLLQLLSPISPLDPIENTKMALLLGADVPVCFIGRTARVQGIGEILTPIEKTPALPVLLVNPGIELTTKEVFTTFDSDYSKPLSLPRTGENFGATDLLDFLGRRPENDLMAPAIKLAPKIGHVLEELESLPGVVSVGMSGSGATCFALFCPNDKINVTLSVNQIKQTGWWFESTFLNS